MRIVGNAFNTGKNSPVVRPIYLYSILYDPTANSFLRMTNWPGGVTFDGVFYKHYAVIHSGINEEASGMIQKASITLSNANREMQALLDDNEGLRERKVTITQVWEDTLADPTAFISDILTVEQASVTEERVTLSLASELDVLNIMLPRRVMTRTFCRFTFKSAECAYAGSEQSCNKTFNRCRELVNQKHFGAFPATPLTKTYLRGI